MSPDEGRGTSPPPARVLAASAALMDEAAAAVRRASVLDDRLADAAEVDVGATPSEVVYTENKLELLRYESLTDGQHEVPILIVYALINRPYILDLQRDRSVVRRLLEAGHDVYLVDWNEPTRLDQHLGLYDYVCRYVDNCVDDIRERSGQEAINLLGYCMGGTMAAMYTALNPEKVNALALMAPPLHLDDTGGVLEQWGQAEYYDPQAVVDAYGNAPGDFLAAGFAQMDPVTNYVSKYVALLDNLENEDFVKNFARMERWLGESVDLAGAAYVEFLAEVYQGNRLVRGEITLGGDPVDPGNIDVPLLLVLGKYDNLVPPAASKPFADVVGTERVTTIEYPTGHVGLAVSNSVHREVWPEVAEWFLDQSTEPGLADVIGDGIEQALGVDVETDVTVGDHDEVEISVAADGGDPVRQVVAHEAHAVEAFFEESLGVEIGVEVGATGVAVQVRTPDGVETVVVEYVGQAIRDEIREAVDALDIAATYDLEDVDGIGPTYADRLREAGIESVSGLAVADPVAVADAADAAVTLARTWIGRAGSLLEAKRRQRATEDGATSGS